MRHEIIMNYGPNPNKALDFTPNPSYNLKGRAFIRTQTCALPSKSAAKPTENGPRTSYNFSRNIGISPAKLDREIMRLQA